MTFRIEGEMMAIAIAWAVRLIVFGDSDDKNDDTDTDNLNHYNNHGLGR